MALAIPVDDVREKMERENKRRKGRLFVPMYEGFYTIGKGG